jgi:hypothetical protein
MATDRLDDDRGAVAFPLCYCLVCSASLEVFISYRKGRVVQKINCRVCRSMKGEISLRADTLLAEGWLAIGDIKRVYDPSFLLHNPKIEFHQDQTHLEVWTARTV